MSSRVSPPPEAVRIDAPARLHMGVLDLRPGGDRYFGGMGVALDGPRVRLELARADGLEVEGPESETVRALAGRHLERIPDADGAAIRVVETIPRHVGLGSGTQLALSVARGLDLLHGLERPADELAVGLGRGKRSGVGTWTFARGGFVLEGGTRKGRREVAPLLCRHALPESWRAVLVRPPVPRGLSDDREAAAFEELPAPEPGAAERVAYVVLMALLPALVTGDLLAFGEAADEVERATGDAFRPAQQGSRYAHDAVAEAVAELRERGAVAVGQSSWGPTVYGFVASEERARETVAPLVADRPEWSVSAVAFDNRGARHRVSSGSLPPR